MIGGSRSRTDTRSSSTVDTQNLNLQDIEGLAVAGVRGPVNIELSDQGAIEAGTEIALAGIGGFEENVQLTRDIIQAGRAQSETVAGLAGAVLARESQNVDPRLENITQTALIAAGVVVAIIVFRK